VDVLSPAITAGVYGGYLHLWYRNADGILVSPRTLGIVSAVDGTTAEVTVSGTVQVRPLTRTVHSCRRSPHTH
jgi:hypothetical protein